MTLDGAGHVQHLLPAFLNGSLSLAERERVSNHLSECAECSAALAEWTRIGAAAERTTATVSAPPRLARNLMNRLLPAPASSAGRARRQGRTQPATAGARGSLFGHRLPDAGRLGAIMAASLGATALIASNSGLAQHVLLRNHIASGYYQLADGNVYSSANNRSYGDSYGVQATHTPVTTAAATHTPAPKNDNDGTTTGPVAAAATATPRPAAAPPTCAVGFILTGGTCQPPPVATPRAVTFSTRVVSGKIVVRTEIMDEAGRILTTQDVTAEFQNNLNAVVKRLRNALQRARRNNDGIFGNDFEKAKLEVLRDERLRGLEITLIGSKKSVRLGVPLIDDAITRFFRLGPETLGGSSAASVNAQTVVGERVFASTLTRADLLIAFEQTVNDAAGRRITELSASEPPMEINVTLPPRTAGSVYDPARFLVVNVSETDSPACPAGVHILPSLRWDATTRTVSTQARCMGTVMLMETVELPTVADYSAGAGARFFSQATGAPVGQTGIGYLISDDDGVRFYSEFERLGGVPALGYPASNRTELDDGFTVQVTQKAVLQWRPDIGQVWFANVFDELSDKGFDDFLHTSRQIPRPFNTASDANQVSFEEVVASHVIKILSGYDLTGTPVPGLNPAAVVALRSFYLSNPNWRTQYGLPMSIGAYPQSIVVRGQRAAFQYWLTDQPFGTKAGQITIVNGGDLSKEAGLWDFDTTQPIFAPDPSTAPAP